MLKERGVPYRYRESTKEPLSEAELRELLGQLGLPAVGILRTRDMKSAGLDGTEPDAVLIAAMARDPNLIQRPIGVRDGRAVLGRPVEALLELA